VLGKFSRGNIIKNILNKKNKFKEIKIKNSKKHLKKHEKNDKKLKQFEGRI